MAIAERVKSIIADQLEVGEAEIQLDASLTDDLRADSLDMVELVMAFEDEFYLEIPDEEAEELSTVRDVIEYIEIHRGNQE